MNAKTTKKAGSAKSIKIEKGTRTKQRDAAKPTAEKKSRAKKVSKPKKARALDAAA